MTGRKASPLVFSFLAGSSSGGGDGGPACNRATKRNVPNAHNREALVGNELLLLIII